MSEEKLLTFPCLFPIKVMGMNSAGLREIAIELVEQHAGELADDVVKSRPSRNGKFVAVTITINAQSQQQLDDIYHSLTDHKAVLFAL